MKRSTLGVLALIAIAQACAPHQHTNPLTTTGTDAQRDEVLRLSRDKWRWMSERKVDSLAAILDEQTVFVHMGATMTKRQELDVIRGGMIAYKTVDIQEASARFVGTTAIVLNRIRLVAVVGGNEVTNPFVVTEVYVPRGDAWTLASLSFTRLLTPP